MVTRSNGPWQTDGKFFRCGGLRIAICCVTYGPFPGGWPVSMAADFARIRDAGFNAIRIYQMPCRSFLDTAEAAGLKVFGGLRWAQNSDFLGTPRHLSAARVALTSALRETADHPALAGVYVANEIPSDLVRWMGPTKVRRSIEELIELGREAAPHQMFAYANYPSTEYLEPGNADFTAFNVYLEDESALRAYLGRLHHIAGDRPVVISEFGLDSSRHGTGRQAKLLANAIGLARDAAVAGITLFAWSDRWLSGGDEVFNWDFGLTDRTGHDKPAVAAVRAVWDDSTGPRAELPTVSLIICTRNGRDRIHRCLDAIRRLRHGPLQTIVVDDGSTDGTSEAISASHPWVELIKLPPCGLSAARNAGAAAARGEILAFTDDDCEPDRDWLGRIAEFFSQHPNHAAVGGPNLPQVPHTDSEAVVCAAPGAPSHVMLDDTTAEHLPGCNIAVRKSAFIGIDGFDKRFHTAGDDVDFCWRLQDAGHLLGFDPGAFVWHWRRPSIRAFLKQQIGYGKAERLLRKKFPQRFSRSGAPTWHGFIYSGAPVRVVDGSIIYHGPMGSAGYQSLQLHMQPLRELAHGFNHWRTRLALSLTTFIASTLRGWHRSHRIRWSWPTSDRPDSQALDHREIALMGVTRDSLITRLIHRGWHPCDDTMEWDLIKDGQRILLTTELGDHGYRRTLVRIDGALPMSDLRD